jgi:hypothetical protein
MQRNACQRNRVLLAFVAARERDVQKARDLFGVIVECLVEIADLKE